MRILHEIIIRFIIKVYDDLFCNINKFHVSLDEIFLTCDLKELYRLAKP